MPARGRAECIRHSEHERPRASQRAARRSRARGRRSRRRSRSGRCGRGSARTALRPSGGNGSLTRLCRANLTSERSFSPTTSAVGLLAEVALAHGGVERARRARRRSCPGAPARAHPRRCRSRGCGRAAVRGRTPRRPAARGCRPPLPSRTAAIQTRTSSTPRACALVEQEPPVDARELLVIAQERRLLDRDLLDQPRDQPCALERIGHAAQERLGVAPRLDAVERRLEVRVLAVRRGGSRSPGTRARRRRRARSSRRRSARPQQSQPLPDRCGREDQLARRARLPPWASRRPPSWPRPARSSALRHAATSPRPSAPSRPMPVSTTATPPAPAPAAMLRSRTSADGRCGPASSRSSRASCPPPSSAR